MTYQGIDTAARISARAAKILCENGIDFAVRYLVPESGGTAWKALSASEAADIRGAGLALMLVWETTAKRMRDGKGAGDVDGTTARELAEAMGVPPGTVIYFAADYAVPEADYKAVYDYLYAASIAAAPYRVGLYGSENIVAAMDARKACQHFWQCVGGSDKLLPCAAVIQYEWQGGAEAKALAGKVGFAVDLDSAETLSGMWAAIRPSTEAEDALAWAKSVGIVTDDMEDVTQAAIMLYRYHRAFSPEDNWSIGSKE